MDFKGYIDYRWCRFIGSHVVRLFVNEISGISYHNLDKLTYAGNLANLADIEQQSNYTL